MLMCGARGIQCAECSLQTLRFCKDCRGGYCVFHNEGSSGTTVRSSRYIHLEKLMVMRS